MELPERTLHYRLRQRLELRGSGSAWLADDTRLGRLVVLETIAPDVDLPRLEARVRRLAAISHPNVAAIHALELDGGVPFVVREYVDGEPLRAVFAFGALPVSEVVALGTALAGALAHVHARGVLLGGLTSDDVLVDEQGSPRLVCVGRLLAVPDGDDAPRRDDDVAALARLLLEALGDPATGDRAGDRAALRALCHRALGADAPDAASFAAAFRTPGDRPRLAPPRVRPWAVAAVFVLALGAVLGWRLVQARRAAAAAGARIVYVAPMQVVGERADPYLGAAFSRSLSGVLGRVHPLRVLAAPERARLDERSAIAEARRLGARWAVWGTVALDSTEFRSSVSLIDVPPNRLAWTASHQVPAGDVAVLATRLAHEIAGALHVAPPAQYDHYLYSVYSQTLAVAPEMSEALGIIRRQGARAAGPAMEKLVARYPDEAEVRVLDARVQMDAGWETGASSPARQRFVRAVAELRRVDAANPWADVFEALVLTRDGRLRPAIERLGHVLARGDLTPAARAYVHALRGQAWGVVPDSTRALEDLAEAVRLDGMSAINLTMYSMTLASAGRHAEALERARQAVTLAPELSYTRLALSQALGDAGRWPEAADEAARASRLRPVHSFVAWQALALRHAGRESEAVATAARARALPESDFGMAFLARFHALGGDAARARAAFERAMELGFLDTEAPRAPEFTALRSDPTWRKLEARLIQRLVARAPRAARPAIDPTGG